MNEKIKVSKKVDDAITLFRENQFSNWGIALIFKNELHLSTRSFGESICVIQHAFKNVDELYTALINGYEVAQSVDELIVKYHKKAKPEQVAKIMVAAAAEQKRNEQPYYLN